MKNRSLKRMTVMAKVKQKDTNRMKELRVKQKKMKKTVTVAMKTMKKS